MTKYIKPGLIKISHESLKGTRSSKRRLKSMSGREKRFMKDTNHCVSKKLANQPGVAVFVLEDLSSIRTQRRGKKMNKWLGSWAFYQQEQFLTYKAEAFIGFKFTDISLNAIARVYEKSIELERGWISPSTKRETVRSHNLPMYKS